MDFNKTGGMKKIKCPKCGEYLTFDASKYDDGQILVFDCPECHKRFKIRIGRDKLRDKDRETVPTNRYSRSKWVTT